MIHNKNTLLYYQSAKAYGLPAQWIDDNDGFMISLGRRRYYFCVAETPFNPMGNRILSANKYNANKFLEPYGIPVPKTICLSRAEFEQDQLQEKLKSLQFPVVLKPTFGTLGNDVLCNINSMDLLQQETARLFNYNELVNIEEFYGGLKSYRVLVFRNKVIGLIFREGAHVFGDGHHSILELVEISNQHRVESNDALKPIVINIEAEICLQEQGLSLDYIPLYKQKIQLGYTSNATRGGSFAALSVKQICKQNRKLMEYIAELTGLGLIGIDVECEDISRPLASSRGVIIEINHSPSIKIHEYPMAGKSNRVTRRIMRSLIYRHPVSYLISLSRYFSSLLLVRGIIVVISLRLGYHLIK